MVKISSNGKREVAVVQLNGTMLESRRLDKVNGE